MKDFVWGLPADKLLHVRDVLAQGANAIEWLMAHSRESELETELKMRADLMELAGTLAQFCLLVDKSTR